MKNKQYISWTSTKNKTYFGPERITFILVLSRAALFLWSKSQIFTRRMKQSMKDFESTLPELEVRKYMLKSDISMIYGVVLITIYKSNLISNSDFLALMVISLVNGIWLKKTRLILEISWSYCWEKLCNCFLSKYEVSITLPQTSLSGIKFNMKTN